MQVLEMNKFLMIRQQLNLKCKKLHVLWQHVANSSRSNSLKSNKN